MRTLLHSVCFVLTVLAGAPLDAIALREPPDGVTPPESSERWVPDTTERGIPAPRPPHGSSVSAHALEGAWRLLGTVDASKRIQRLPRGTEQYKFVAGDRFVWMVVRQGSVLRMAEGTCRARTRDYSERVESVMLTRDRWMLNTWFRFTVQREGDRWVHRGSLKGPDGQVSVHEVWERVR